VFFPAIPKLSVQTQMPRKTRMHINENNVLSVKTSSSSSQVINPSHVATQLINNAISSFLVELPITKVLMGSIL
jgi:hypothetical protein